LQEQFSGVLNKMTEEYAKLSQKHFEEVCSRFEKEEPRGGFYDMSLRLIESGHNTEGALLLNATWNIATFRYHATKFDIDKFDSAISGLYTESKTDYLGLNFETMDFRVLKGPGKTFDDDLQDKICKTYDSFAEIGGIGYTGATKIMHLFQPELFVPWDQFIRERYVGKKEISGKSYIDFLDKMKEKFGHLNPSKGRTLAKCIDEFNYIKISVPAVKKMNKEREKRAEKKREEMKEFKEWKKK